LTNPGTHLVYQNLINIQEAILKLLDDKELTVVQAALCVDGLPNVIDSCKLLDALLNVLRRCMDKLLSGNWWYIINNYVEIHLICLLYCGTTMNCSVS